MITLNQVQLRRGGRVLFDRASFTVFRGDRVGIVGANGSGKSSLLALIRGELQPEAGECFVPSSLRLASVAQETEPVPRPAIEFVLDGDRELRAVETEMAAASQAHDGERLAALHARFENLDGYSARSRAAQLLDGVGFAPGDLERPVAEFSGGWRMRLNLAQALMSPSDVLLLDEPTNHLDLDAVLWLEGWLGRYPGTLLLIAHDREFLDRVCRRVVHIDHGTVRVYTGNYSQFEIQRAAELANQQALYERQQREIRHVMQFVERFRAKASKARQARSRLRLLERMERIAPAHVDTPFSFEIPEPLKLPRPLLKLEDASVGYDDREVLADLELTLSPGDRIAVLGRNGAGKSTLTRLLAGELAPRRGLRTPAADLLIGYFAQHQLEQLDAHLTPFEQLRHVPEFERASEQQVRDHLGRFGFRGDRAFDDVAIFSGGERARLVLALLVARRPNLLLLDEPTNHLDLDMRHALGMALQDYGGALVVVSHDRHLIRSVADELWLVHAGRLERYDGDLDDYAAWLEAERSAPRSAGEPREQADTRRARKRAEAERRNRLSPLRAAVRAAEEEIAKLEAARRETEAALADPGLYAEEARAQLGERLRQRIDIARALAAAEARWLEASEALEAAEREP